MTYLINIPSDKLVSIVSNPSSLKKRIKSKPNDGVSSPIMFESLSLPLLLRPRLSMLSLSLQRYDDQSNQKTINQYIVLMLIKIYRSFFSLVNSRL